jgi:uncharacterized membrane protein YbhN (UPF0104 family)
VLVERVSGRRPIWGHRTGGVARRASEAPVTGAARRSVALRWFVAIGVSVAAFWILFREVDAEAFFGALRRVELPWVLACVAFQVAYHLCRIFRWGQLVQPVRRVSARSVLSINAIGYLAINILPFRMGEFVRPALLTEREGVSFSSGVAVSVVDRLLDIAALGVLFVLMISFADLPAETVVIGGAELSVTGDGRRVVAFSMVLFGAVAAVPLLLGEFGERLAHRLLGHRLGGIYSGFRVGLSTVGDVRALGWASVLNGFGWFFNLLGMWCLLRGFGLDQMTLWSTLVVMVFLIVGVMLPAPPGFAGVFEAFAAAALIIYGVEASIAAAYAVTLHVLQLVLLFLFGGFFLWMDGLSFSRLLSLSRTERAGDADGPGSA